MFIFPLYKALTLQLKKKKIFILTYYKERHICLINAIQQD
jgi:hypothetical protein